MVNYSRTASVIDPVERRVLRFGKPHELPGRIPSFQRFVFTTAASRAAPVREAVISVPTRSRNRTR